MITKEILYEAFCKTIAHLVPQAENPVNGDVEESYRTGLQGILRSIYNRGIQDAVDATQLTGAGGTVIDADENELYWVHSDEGVISVGENDLLTPCVRINTEEILKLKA
jgi:hypothetical protein